MPLPKNTYGIDTSIFLRLLTGHPQKDFEATSAALVKLHNDEPSTELVVSNQVIAEAYFALQHHYEVSKKSAQTAILNVLTSGMIRALNGQKVIEILKSRSGAGLADWLIAQDYSAQDCQTLTNDKRMAKVPDVRLLT